MSEPDLWRLDSLRAAPYKVFSQEGTEISPQLSPDGSKILYVRKHGGWRSVWVVNADGSESRQLAGRLWLTVAAWAPDGKRVAVIGSRGGGAPRRLYVVSASGSGLRPVGGVENMTNALAWTPDGRWITCADADGRIWRVRPDGSAREAIGEIADREVRRLFWSPDGRHLAYTGLNWERFDSGGRD